MLTIGYIRVASTDKYPGRGVQAQAQTIRERAAAEHADLELITDTGASGMNMNRPGLRRMLSLVAGGNVQRVLVTSLDRLTRSREDFARLLERLDSHGVSLVSVDGTFDSRSTRRPAVHAEATNGHQRILTGVLTSQMSR